MKFCKKCSQHKPLDDFSVWRCSKDGRQAYCKACNKAYRVANNDRVLAVNAAYREANRGELLAYWHRYREENRQKVLAAQRRHYDRNRDLIAAYKREYRKNNAEKIRQHNRKRAALARGARRSELIDRQRVWERDGGLCHICGKKTIRSSFTLDHLVPLSKGGDDTYENVRVAHGPCNSRRGAGRLPAQLLLVG